MKIYPIYKATPAIVVIAFLFLNELLSFLTHLYITIIL